MTLDNVPYIVFGFVIGICFTILFGRRNTFIPDRSNGYAPKSNFDSSIHDALNAPYKPLNFKPFMDKYKGNSFKHLSRWHDRVSDFITELKSYQAQVDKRYTLYISKAVYEDKVNYNLGTDETMNVIGGLKYVVFNDEELAKHYPFFAVQNDRAKGDLVYAFYLNKLVTMSFMNERMETVVNNYEETLKRVLTESPFDAARNRRSNIDTEGIW